MLFTQAVFGVFFLAVLAVHWALPGHRARKLWLLGASWLFYARWDERFLALILVSTLVDWVAGLAIARTERPRARRAWLLASLGVNLGILGFFKYQGFFVESAAALLESLGFRASLPVLEVVLPVGISFYTFQTLSYTIDVYRRRLEPTRDLADFALFVAFFPQLVAGPIVRAADFLPQLREPRRLAAVAVRPALALFLVGYVKKACLADNLAPVVDRVFAEPAAYGPAASWIAVALYAIQIYGDFSGYTDMAIATAALLGYRLPLNFDHPYVATSVTDFWRRWHISLSSWFRDYLYVPLGGNRGPRWRRWLNLVTVFFLCGLWHGASWTFVAWGLLHGLFLVLERVSGLRPPPGASAGGGGLARLGLRAYTLLVVLLAWVLFRASDFGAAARVWTSLGGRAPDAALAAGATPVDPLWALVPAVFLALHAAGSRGLFERAERRLPDPLFAVVLGLATALALAFAASGYRPFIYFQF